MITARKNPFASHRIDALDYRFHEGNWQDLLTRLEQMQNRGAIIGPYGAGKTTLLEQLAQRFKEQGISTVRIFVNNDRPRLVTADWSAVMAAGRLQVVLIDGADLLSYWEWGMIRLIRRSGRGLVIAGHRPLGLPVIADCRTSMPILDELLQDLLGQCPEAISDQAHDLFRRHNGNIRDVFRDMYLLTARLP